MLTERERDVLRGRKRRRIVIGGAALLILALGAVLARPVGSAIKGWQARRHARNAFALIEQEKWADARTEATAAYQLRLSEPDALRAIARFLSRTRQPQALDFWEQLAKVEALTPTDLRDETAVALLAGDDSRASRAVEELLRAGTKAAAGDWLLAAQLAIHRNSATDARAAVEKAWGHPQASHREKLQAALIESAIAREHEDWRTEALARVKEIADTPDAVGLDALTVLAQTLLGVAQSPANFPATAAQLAKSLEGHPLARAPQKLLAVDLKIRDDPAQKDALIGAAVEQWKATDGAELATLATWLNGKGEYQRQLDAIPVEAGLRNRDVFLQHVDALGALGRWGEIEDLLGTQRYPLDPVVEKMYLARCNAQLGEKAASENNWQRALEIARGDPAKLLTLGNYAEKNGAAETARGAFDEAAAESPKLRPAQQGRLRCAQAAGKIADLHGVLAEMLALWPNDTAVQNDEAYLRLLLPDAVKSAPAIEQLAETLVAKEPASLPHRTLLALARLRQGRAEAALAVYAQLQIAPGALTSSALAVHAAVLAAAGKNEDAQTEAKQIPGGGLLPEEAALISPLSN